MSEKRDVENGREGAIGDAGRLRRETRFRLCEPLVQFGHVCAAGGDSVGTVVSFNLPHGQSHDESGFTWLRGDLDLTAMPVSHDTLAYGEAETLSRTDALGGEKRLKDVREIFRRDTRAIVDDLHDGLVVVAPGLDRDFSAAVDRISCVIEQVNPDLRKFAWIAPD